MIRTLLPVFLGLGGLVIGAAAGFAVRPPEPDAPAPPEEAASATVAGPHDAKAETADPGHDSPAAAGHGGDAPRTGAAEPGLEYVRFPNQFVVPVIENERVAAMVVLSLGLEVGEGMTERVYAIEPRLRDAMLRVLFDHANAGGFSGSFTDGAAMEPLRAALREVALRELGPDARDVLIVDIVRQDG